jgi:hypothetical protein
MEMDQEVQVEDKETAKTGKKEKSCSRCALKGHLAVAAQ